MARARFSVTLPISCEHSIVDSVFAMPNKALNKKTFSVKNEVTFFSYCDRFIAVVLLCFVTIVIIYATITVVGLLES